MLNQLTELEEVTHRRGWDQPMVLHLLTDSRSLGFPLPTRGDPVGALQLMAPNPLPVLDQLAHRAGNLDQATFRDTLPQLHGVALVCETWMRAEVVPDEYAGRDLADIPGSVEARLVIGVDHHGQVHVVNRVRGDEPYTLTEAEGDAYTGRMIDTVRALATRLMAQARDGSAV